VDLIEISSLIALGLVLVTSLWVLVDARRNRVPTRGHTYTANTGAGAWFLGCLLLWIVVFPKYLARRRFWSLRQEQCETFAQHEELARAEKELQGEPYATTPDGRDRWDLVAIIEAQRLGRFDPVHLAPIIPAKLLRGAVNGLLDLAPGELLLAVIDPSLRMRPGKSWVVTTQRVLSCDPHRRDRSTTTVKEWTKVGEGEFEPALGNALGQYLRAIGPAMRATGPPPLPAPLADFASGLVPRLVDLTVEFRAEQQSLGEFRTALRTETPRVVVTPALVLVCLAVFLLMVIRGVSPVAPSVRALLDWGAEFGLSVALDHEYWRLFSASFVHIGILHLLVNIVCLLWVGPTVERLFGNLAFAAVYLLSGLGGAIASMVVHPMLVSAGASGSIFGVFGALVGFLVVRRRTIPRSVMKPLYAIALSFIAYNVIAGMRDPRIDQAAHLGGLATGFVCGLLLNRRLPAVPGRRGIARRFAAGAAMTVALVVAAQAATYAVRREPQVRAIIRSRQAETYNQLVLSIMKPLHGHLGIRRYIERVLTNLPYLREPFGDDAIIDHASGDVQAFHRLSADDRELRIMLDSLVTAAAEMGEAAGIVKRVLDACDVRLPRTHTSRWSKSDWQWLQAVWDEAEKPLRGKVEASQKAMEQALSLRDRYLQDRGLDARSVELLEVRRRFRDEAARIRQMHHMNTPDLPPQIYASGRQQLAELEAMRLEQEWFWRLPSPYPGESSGAAP
jgi:rhomboid protease GluP